MLLLLRCAPVLSLQRRRHHHFLLFHLFFYLSSSSSSFSFSTMSKAAEPNNASPSVPPPVAEKKPHRMEMFGDVRVDDYYWLRDDTRSNPQILDYLGEENRYAQSILNDKKELQDQLYSELRGRIQEDDISAPTRDGPYFYYTRTLQGKEYVQHCRRSIPGGEGPGDVNEVMPTGPNAPEEHIILDENLMSQGHEYYKIGAFKVNPNHKIVGYAEDTKGDEIYTMHVMDAETRNPFGEPLVGITEYIEWAGTDMLLYVTMDEAHRPYKVWRHKLGSNQTDDECLYHEEDDMFSVYLEASESKQYLFVASESKTTRFVLYLDVSKPNEGLKVLAPRMAGVDIHVSHSGDHFFIKRRTDETFNSEILICPVNNVSATSLVLPHRESVKIQDMQLFSGHMTVYERENGLPKVTVYNLPSAGEAIRPFQDGQLLKFADPAYAVEPEDSQYSSHILRFYYSSMRTPPSIYDYDMNTGICILKKLDKILGGFESANYATERRWAVATDGTQIPISIVYRKNLAKLDGTDPLLLYGYGSYEVCVDPDFRATRLSLLDRGFVYAIAHIRGGGEMGRKWYEDGKLLKKRNTFTDFITCAEYLLENKFGSKEKLCIHGRSAGGLLIGAVLNMRPDLFKAAVAGVPFVDVVTTMLDPSIPLTTEEWEEWGDPRKEEFYFYMKSYSPVDNIKAQEYPNILVTAGLNDPRVLYSEPAKYVAKLRSTKMDQNILLFKCDLGAGHSSKSGRFEKLEEDAFTYTFILKALDMAR